MSAREMAADKVSEGEGGRQLKIGLLVYLGGKWQAGLSTAASILEAVRTLDAPRPEVAVVVWAGLGPQEPEALAPLADQIIRLPYQAQAAAGPRSISQRMAHWLGGQRATHPNHTLDRIRSDGLRREGVDCVFSTPMEHRPDFGVPLLLWLPDFQHVHLPELFSAKERAERNQLYRQEIERADLVMVKSEAVRQDLEAFAPTLAGKARVLPLVVAIPPETYQQEPGLVARRYHVPERFFFLPNQFWQHKNHKVVLEALRRLKDQGDCPTVVCTGFPSDHRDPQHFANLWRLAAELDLREHFIYLGVLPRADVLALMRQCVCLLSPSVFEGFGFSVAESKALGKRSLVSDLPAHREQQAPEAAYFDPHQADDLAEKMAMIWKTATPGPDPTREAAARAAQREQQAAFGRAFGALAAETVSRAAARPGPGR